MKETVNQVLYVFWCLRGCDIRNPTADGQYGATLMNTLCRRCILTIVVTCLSRKLRQYARGRKNVFINLGITSISKGGIPFLPARWRTSTHCCRAHVSLLPAPLLAGVGNAAGQTGRQGRFVKLQHPSCYW